MAPGIRTTVLGCAALLAALSASSVSAGGPKPPKSLCVDWDTFADYQVLQIKSLGSTNTAAGKVPFYSVAGFAYNGNSIPVGGGAYMSGTTVHLSFNGLTNGGTANLYRVNFDTATNTGTVRFVYHSPNGTTVTDQTDTVTGVDCSTITLPAIP